MFVGDGGFDRKGLIGRAGSQCRLHPGVINGGMIGGAAVALALPAYMPFTSRRQQRAEVESAGGAHLLQQIDAPDRCLERGQAERGQQHLQVAGELLEKADNVRRLAAEFRAQIGSLRGNARRTGVEVTLARHVAAQRHQHRGAKGEFVGAQQRGDQHIAASAQSAIATQAHASAQAVLHQHLLRFGQPDLPGIAGIFDAGEGRSAGASGVTGDHDVVRVGLRHPSGYGANAALGDQLDADGGARIHPLEVEDQLGQIFNGVNVMVRRRADERDPGLGVAQTRDQLGDLMAGELAAFARLGALGDLDLDLLGVGEVLGGDAKAGGSHLLHLVIEDRRSPGISRVGRRIFPALAGIGASAELVHRLGDGLVRLRAERAQRHGGSNEAAHDGGGAFHLVQRQRGGGGTDLQQVAQHRGLVLDRLGAEGGPGLAGQHRPPPAAPRAVPVTICRARTVCGCQPCGSACSSLRKRTQP